MTDALRDCFLKTLWDTDATDFTEFAEKTVIKRFLSVVSVREASVYKKDDNKYLRNTFYANKGSYCLPDFIISSISSVFNREKFSQAWSTSGRTRVSPAVQSPVTP